MRTLLKLLFAAFLVFLVTSVRASEPDVKLHKQCLYPTIKVVPEGKGSYGTGVIVRSMRVADGEFRNVFITCAHIADSHLPYFVMVYKYEKWSTVEKIKPYPCTFYGKDEARDVAVGVFISEEKMPTATIDFDTALYIGTPVFHFGCGVGDDPRLDEGKVTSVRNKLKRDGPSFIRTNVTTVPGDSGGPLFHKYNVVGIAKSIRVWNDNMVWNMSYYIPIEKFKEWSNDNDEALHFVWGTTKLPDTPYWVLNFGKKWETAKK